MKTSQGLDEEYTKEGRPPPHIPHPLQYTFRDRQEKSYAYSLLLSMESANCRTFISSKVQRHTNDVN